MSRPAISTAAPGNWFELVARLHREHQLTSLIATHNLAFTTVPSRFTVDQGKNGRSSAGVASGAEVENRSTNKARELKKK
jgi:hypothetical protein